MGLFLMGCFTGDSQEGKRPMKAFEETAIKGGKRLIEGKRPIKANGLFAGTPTMVENGPSKKAL